MTSPADVVSAVAPPGIDLSTLRDDIAFVRDLLWAEHLECCGRPVVGAEYMGQQEQLCCGCPEPALLSDAQIVASLRERFPESSLCSEANRGAPAGATAETPPKDQGDPHMRRLTGLWRFGAKALPPHGIMDFYQFRDALDDNIDALTRQQS